MLCSCRMHASSSSSSQYNNTLVPDNDQDDLNPFDDSEIQLSVLFQNCDPDHVVPEMDPNCQSIGRILNAVNEYNSQLPPDEQLPNGLDYIHCYRIVDGKLCIISDEENEEDEPQTPHEKEDD